MKRLYKTLVAFVAVVALTLPALAIAGAYLPGIVYFAGDTLIADFNVRFNAASGSNDSIGITGSPGQIINIIGAKGSGGTVTYWSCYVPTTSTLYPTASALLNSATNGYRLIVARSGSVCTNFNIETYSYRLN